MAYPLVWPQILVPTSERWQLRGGYRGGERSITGGLQSVAGPSGWWTATRTVPIRTNEQILAFRAMMAAADGPVNAISMGPWDYPRVPWATDAFGRKVTPKLVRNPRLDGTPYADSPGLIDGLVVATLSVAALMNATSCKINVATGGVLKAGQYFGVGGRLHMIADVVSVVGAVSTVSFRPWLRADVAAGAAVNLVSPKTLMQLASDDTGSLDLELSRRGTVTIELVEAV